MELKNTATAEEEYREALLSASNHTVAAKLNPQELGTMDVTASLAVEKPSSPIIDSEKGGRHRSRK